MQIFREDTGAWLVKPMGGFVRALRDVGTAANIQAKVPVGKNGYLGEAAAKMNALFSSAHQGAGEALHCRVAKPVGDEGCRQACALCTHTLQHAGTASSQV